MEVLFMYSVIINVYGFVVMGVDKRKAINKSKRIREKTLFIVALLGGSFGVLIGMRLFRHKTKHLSFIYGIPVCLMFNASIYLYIIYLIK